MRNPWLDLPEISPYILEIDRDSLSKLHERVLARGSEDHTINLTSVPEPFIGNPHSATVVLLNLNPGDGPEDKDAHLHPRFRAAMFANLSHNLKEYPFYPLHPELAWTPCAQWWRPRLRALCDIGGLELATVAQRLCVIEWFPYHSRKAGFPIKRVCPSQEYSFELAKKAIGNRLIVGMRARRHWNEVHSQFAEVPYLKNPQSPYISPGNAGRLFPQIVAALRKP
ncbi:MAG: hypothetical protein M1453_12865 [Acidobacteria bacterium]|nr:hypothetical protein [Acidobacteriota bacterium]